MPSHAHAINLAIDGSNNIIANKDRVALNGYGNSTWWANCGESTSRGGDTAHNNLQPYFCCYIFKRTA